MVGSDFLERKLKCGDAVRRDFNRVASNNRCFTLYRILEFLWYSSSRGFNNCSLRFVVSFVIFCGLKKGIGVRVSEEEKIKGFD